VQHDVASGGDKLAAAIQKPTAEQQSAQSVMAAQSNGKGTGGRGAAAGRDGNHGAADRGRGRCRGRGGSAKPCAAAASRNM